MVHVLSVRDAGDGVHATWHFDTNVASLTDASSLWVNGNPPDFDFSISGPKDVTVGYSSGFETGDNWNIVGPPAGLTFAGGATLPFGAYGTVV
jgi:hypothetical protein